MDPDLVAAVAAVAGGDKINVSRFCAEHKISRTVFYKYVQRFREEGAAGFLRRSSAPQRRPGRCGCPPGAKSRFQAGCGRRGRIAARSSPWRFRWPANGRCPGEWQLFANEIVRRHAADRV
ncbi:helix-turn-helix domain-containing protein [Saccharopolyspora sp. NPDC003752]